jgi:hypothetical protein
MVQKICRMIDGYEYNTSSSKCVHEKHIGDDWTDAEFEVTGLYLTPLGQWFLAGFGGRLSQWAARSFDDRHPICGSGLRLVSSDEAQSLIEEDLEDECLPFGECFGAKEG